MCVYICICIGGNYIQIIVINVQMPFVFTTYTQNTSTTLIMVIKCYSISYYSYTVYTNTHNFTNHSIPTTLTNERVVRSFDNTASGS